MLVQNLVTYYVCEFSHNANCRAVMIQKLLKRAQEIISRLYSALVELRPKQSVLSKIVTLKLKSF